MTTHSISVAVPAGLTGAAVTSALEGAAGLGLVVALVAFVAPQVPQVLDVILHYRVRAATVRMQADAVAKTKPVGLPALFASFTPVEMKPDSPDLSDGVGP